MSCTCFATGVMSIGVQQPDWTSACCKLVWRTASRASSSGRGASRLVSTKPIGKIAVGIGSRAAAAPAIRHGNVKTAHDQTFIPVAPPSAFRVPVAVLWRKATSLILRPMERLKSPPGNGLGRRTLITKTAGAAFASSRSAARADDASRQDACRDNVIHDEPLCATLALGQFLVRNKWTRWGPAFGSHRDEALLASAYRRTAHSGAVRNRGAASPLPGFRHQSLDLDTLGFAPPETRCEP